MVTCMIEQTTTVENKANWNILLLPSSLLLSVYWHFVPVYQCSEFYTSLSVYSSFIPVIDKVSFQTFFVAFLLHTVDMAVLLVYTA